MVTHSAGLDDSTCVDLLQAQRSLWLQTQKSHMGSLQEFLIQCLNRRVLPLFLLRETHHIVTRSTSVNQPRDTCTLDS